VLRNGEGMAFSDGLKGLVPMRPQHRSAGQFKCACPKYIRDVQGAAGAAHSVVATTAGRGIASEIPAACLSFDAHATKDIDQKTISERATRATAPSA